MLVPAYHPVFKISKSTHKNVTVWPNDAASIPDCFKCTNWQVYREAATYNGRLTRRNMHHLSATSVSALMITTTRKITIWAERPHLFWSHGTQFWLGYASTLRAWRMKLDTGAKRAKANYSLKIQGHFSTNNPGSQKKTTKKDSEREMLYEGPIPSLVLWLPTSLLTLRSGVLPHSMADVNVKWSVIYCKAPGPGNIPE